MTRAISVLAVAACLLSACSTVTSGTGSGGGPATGGAPSQRQFPPTSSTAPRPSGAPGPTGAPVSPSPSRSAPSDTATPETTLSVTGAVSGKSYPVQVWATSTITDCAAHAYGTALVTLLNQHPCAKATRRLLTLPAPDGRTIAMSTVAVQCRIGGAASKLTDLEKARGTGSMNDLLREGVRLPDFGSAIPSNEAFVVAGQGSVVTVFDAWYTSGATAVDAPELVRIEHDLFSTPIAVPAD